MSTVGCYFAAFDADPWRTVGQLALGRFDAEIDKARGHLLNKIEVSIPQRHEAKLAAREILLDSLRFFCEQLIHAGGRHQLPGRRAQLAGDFLAIRKVHREADILAQAGRLRLAARHSSGFHFLSMISSSIKKMEINRPLKMPRRHLRSVSNFFISFH